ncbi:MAG: ABC transporter ATP-binding protein [Planctomycetota bacterium]
MPDEFVIRIRSLTHRYGQTVAVNDLTWKIAPATIVAVLGPNGCGKTTLFKILTGVLSPSEGEVSIFELPFARERRIVLGRMGVVFQKPSLDGKLTVMENLTYHGRLFGLSGEPLIRRCTDCLQRFGLSDSMKIRVDKLSGGMQRRVEIAKATLHQPELLILDEPSTGLDPGARQAVMRHLHDLRDKDRVTAVLTTHLMEEADRCDVVAVMDKGRLVACDTPLALKSQIGGDVITIHAPDPSSLAARLLGRFQIPASVVGDMVRMEKDSGFEFVPKIVEAFPGEIKGISVGKPTLEDVFIHYTGHALNELESDEQNATRSA